MQTVIDFSYTLDKWIKLRDVMLSMWMLRGTEKVIAVVFIHTDKFSNYPTNYKTLLMKIAKVNTQMEFELSAW